MTDIQDAIELFSDCRDAWSEPYEKIRHSIRFAGGDQWDSNDINIRDGLKLPSLVINHCPKFIHQVMNSIRMNVPTVDFYPDDDDSDIESAKMLKGWFKAIEYASNASYAYDTAAEYAVRGGLGFITLDHDYVTPDGFEQQIVIRSVVNPLSTYIDPNSIEPDGSDGDYGFRLDQLSQSAFKRLYPGYNPTSFGDKEPNRMNGKASTVTVAELFKKDFDTKQFALTDEGETVEYQKGMDGVKSVRTFKKWKIIRQKLSGDDVLEETTFPGKYIPIIPVYGEQVWEDGKRKLYSLISHSMDAQKMLNYFASIESEVLQKQPIAPIMAAEGQTEDFAEDYRNPRKSMVLRYKTYDDRGNPLPPPQRLAPSVTPTGLVNARMEYIQALKDTTGMYDASLGERSNETSGTAINSRKQEGAVGTYHFGDNLTRSVAQVGRCALSMRGDIYDTDRRIPAVMGEDKPSFIRINSQTLEQGQEQPLDMTKGRYSVRVTTGPAFNTLRQEQANTMQQLIQASPPLMQVAGDLLVKAMNFPGSEVLAERLKKAMPPQLTAGEDEPGQSDPQKIQMQQIIQAGTQHIQQLEQALQQCQQELQSKQADMQLKQSDNVVKSQDIQAKVQMAAMQAEIDKIELAIKGTELEIKKAELALKQSGLQEQAHVQQGKEVQPQAQGPVDEASDAHKVLTAQQGNMTVAALADLRDQLSQLNQRIAQPKTVIRDPKTGQVAGIQ